MFLQQGRDVSGPVEQPPTRLPTPAALVATTFRAAASMSQQPESFGAVLAQADPGVWRALLAAHTADAAGCCTRCRRASGPAERWPCRLWDAAEHARRLVGP